jgi:predicted methyltransferase
LTACGASTIIVAGGNAPIHHGDPPMKRLILAAMLAAGLAGAAHADDDALKAAIAGTHRAATSSARDVYRHPYETLTFFGIKPTMTVVELFPEGGWYTNILAPYLHDHGKLIGAQEATKPTDRPAIAFQQKLAAYPKVYDKVVFGVFDPPSSYNFAPVGSVDMVVTFRNIHNFMGLSESGRTAMFKQVYDSLKPGGVFGVVEHRLPAAMPMDAAASTGYMHEAAVIKMIEAAGFKLAAKSEVNANPKDKANHKGGVWALPPTYTNKDVDRARYEAIGESDRMTLKFVKP